MSREEKSAGIILYYMKEDVPYFILLKYPTYWGFAKGIIEKGEKEIETALRETTEETGIEKFEIIKGFEHNQKWFFRFNNELVHKEAVFFLGKTTEQEAQNSKISFEHEGFVWLPLEKASGKMKVKNNQEMLQKAHDFILDYEKQKKLF
jgi:8-oxo-dGTP pyrophosphatase MutT (NUDIX family)